MVDFICLITTTDLVIGVIGLAFYVEGELQYLFQQTLVVRYCLLSVMLLKFVSAPIPIRPILGTGTDLRCSNRWFFSCWVKLIRNI